MLGYELFDACGMGFPDFLLASLAQIDRFVLWCWRAPGIVISTWFGRSAERRPAQLLGLIPRHRTVVLSVYEN